MVRFVVNKPRNRQRLRAAVVTALLLPVVGAAQGAEAEKTAPPQPAWKWTLDERLAARFDPAAMAEREAEYQAEQDAVRKRHPELLAKRKSETPASPPRPTEMLDGSKTPELFLPGELFDVLLSQAFVSEQESAGLQVSRSDFESWAAALGLGRDLWDRLEETAVPYLKLFQNEKRQGNNLRVIATTGDEEELRICRARAQALEAAIAELGEEAFLRLLYEGVAPYIRQASLSPSDYQRKADELRFQEGGCR
jgi:hypothetical protein